MEDDCAKVWGLELCQTIQDAEGDRTWGMSGIYSGSFKDHIPSTPECLYSYLVLQLRGLYHSLWRDGFRARDSRLRRLERMSKQNPSLVVVKERM